MRCHFHVWWVSRADGNVVNTLLCFDIAWKMYRPERTSKIITSELLWYNASHLWIGLGTCCLLRKVGTFLKLAAIPCEGILLVQQLPNFLCCFTLGNMKVVRNSLRIWGAPLKAEIYFAFFKNVPKNFTSRLKSATICWSATISNNNQQQYALVRIIELLPTSQRLLSLLLQSYSLPAPGKLGLPQWRLLYGCFRELLKLRGCSQMFLGVLFRMHIPHAHTREICRVGRVWEHWPMTAAKCFGKDKGGWQRNIKVK